MKRELSERASALFLALADVDPDERTAWLDAHCDDDGLRQQVRDLLAGLDVPSAFLDPSQLHPSALDGDTPFPPGTRLGEFTVQRVIGSGSAGIVYAAAQRHPPRDVALKVLRRGLAASAARRRFAVEAELLGQFQHPGIARIFAAHPGDHAWPPFIAMELVDGVPVTEWVERERPALVTRLSLVAEICDSVQYAHERGVIHRDLKPANVLVDRGGRPRVLDFGVARTSRAGLVMETVTTEAGQLIGTVPYMSPEQLTGQVDAADTRSDVYALGVLLFRILTGRLPFAHGDPPLPELARRIVEQEPPRLSDVAPDLRGDLDAIAACALAKDRSRRYASAADLAADLRRFTSGLPVMASADSAWYVLRKRVVRYRRALVAAVLAFVALAVLGGYALVERMRAQAANARLQDELSVSNIERGRLLGFGGNLLAAEELLWDELFQHPDSRYARWTLWDLYSRESALWSGVAHPAGMAVTRFSTDGRLLLTGGRDGLIAVFDAATGRRRLELTGHTGSVLRIAALSSDEIVSIGADRTLRTWNLRTGAPLNVLATGDTPLRDLDVVDRDTVVTLAENGIAERWSLSAGKIVATYGDRAVRAWRVAVSPVTGLVAVAFENGDVGVWQLASSRLVWRVRAHGGGATAVIFDPTGGLLATGGGDGEVHLFESASAQLLETRRPENGTVRALAFDAAGNRLAIAGWWHAALWDRANTGVRTAVGSPYGTWDVHVTPDGHLLATCDEVNGRVRVWDLASDPRLDAWRASGARVFALERFDDDAVIAASDDGTLHQRSRRTPEGLRVPLTDRTDGRAFVARLGELVVAAAENGTLSVRDRGTLAPLAITQTNGVITALATSPDGAIFVGERDGTVSRWHWSAGSLTRIYDVAFDTEVLALATHGNTLAVAHREATVMLRDAANGALKTRLSSSSTVFALEFTRDGASLLGGTWTGGVDVWDVARTIRIRTFAGHTRIITALHLSDDGRLLATASRDGSVRLWDPGTGRWLATVPTRAIPPSAVRFLTPARLMIGYQDGAVEVVDLAYYWRHVAGHVEHQLETHERRRGSRYPRRHEVLEWSQSLPTQVDAGER